MIASFADGSSASGVSEAPAASVAWESSEACGLSVSSGGAAATSGRDVRSTLLAPTAEASQIPLVRPASTPQASAARVARPRIVSRRRRR